MSMSITFDIPERLVAEATRVAERQGVSLEEFVARILAQQTALQSEDALLADEAVFEGQTPDDVAARHDHYLYDEL